MALTCVNWLALLVLISVANLTSAFIRPVTRVVHYHPPPARLVYTRHIHHHYEPPARLVRYLPVAEPLVEAPLPVPLAPHPYPYYGWRRK